MEIKLFGKSLFEVKKLKAEAILQQASQSANKSKFLPDFYEEGNNNSSSQFIQLVESPSSLSLKNNKPVKKKSGTIITPKGVYEMKMLHNLGFTINANPEYIEKQLEDFKDKLAIIKSEEWDVRRGVNEVSSIVMRLENRKKYPDFKSFFEEYPYTTTSKIMKVIETHDYLKIGKVAQFIADMPKEALEIMKSYNKHTDQICEKQAVFYIIANKKDFENTKSRRDPILLAQSPFGHFWQILGAWDKEMMLIEEL